MALQQIEEPDGIESGRGHHRGTGCEGKRQLGGEAENVKERSKGQRHVVGTDLERTHELPADGDEVAVGQHDPFRQPGGAARIGEKSQVAGSGGG